MEEVILKTLSKERTADMALLELTTDWLGVERRLNANPLTSE